MLYWDSLLNFIAVLNIGTLKKKQILMFFVIFLYYLDYKDMHISKLNTIFDPAEKVNYYSSLKQKCMFEYDMYVPIY